MSIAKNQRNYAETYLHTQVFDSWSPVMAYALGLFYADGCIHKPKCGGSLRVMFHNTDRVTVQWWHDLLGNQTKIATHHVKGIRKTPLHTSTATSDKIGERLISLGAPPRKSWAGLHLPFMSVEFLPHFMRGFFDGDGGIWWGKSRKSKGGRTLKVSLTCNSPTLRQEIRELLLKTCGAKANETHIHLRLSGSSAEKFCRWVYGGSGTGYRMARKEAVWENWVTFREPFGGLICDTDPYASLRGTRPKPWHPLAGTLSDTEVALSGNVSKGTVWWYRKKMGISSHRSQLA